MVNLNQGKMHAIPINIHGFYIPYYQTYNELESQYRTFLNESGLPLQGNGMFPNGVDAVWTITMALHNSIEPIKKQLNRSVYCCMTAVTLQLLPITIIH